MGDARAQAHQPDLLTACSRGWAWLWPARWNGTMVTLTFSMGPQDGGQAGRGLVVEDRRQKPT